MRRKLASRLWIGLCLACGTIAFVPAARAGEEYRNADKGFGFTVPDGWVKAAPGASKSAVMIYRMTGSFRENVNVNDFPESDADAKQFSTDAFPKEYEPSLRRAMKITSFAKPERTKVAGQFAWKFHYEAEGKRGPLRGTQWFVLNGARGYIITWTDGPSASHGAQVEELVQSFHFLGAETHAAGPAAREYANAAQGYAFTIPAGWFESGPKETAPGTVMIYRMAGQRKENLEVREFAVPESGAKEVAAESFPAVYERNLRKSLHIKSFDKAERSTVAGQFAWKFHYRAEINGVEFLGLQWLTTNQTRGYAISWAGPVGTPYDAPEEIIKTFRFTPVAAKAVGEAGHSTGPETGHEAGREYKNAENGFAFTIPGGWSEDASDAGAAIAISRQTADGQESLNIRAFPLSDSEKKDFATETFPDGCEREIRKRLDVKSFDKPERTQVAGHFAWKLHYRVENNGVDVRTVQWIVRHQSRGYAISWGGRSEANAAEIERLVKSFRFIPVTAKSADAPRHGTGRDYKNVDKAFALTIPDGWTEDAAAETKTAFMIYRATGDFKENVNVQVFPLSADEQKTFTDEAFPKAIEGSVRRTLHIKSFEKPERTTVAGQFAWKMRYVMEINGHECDGTLWAVANNNQAYAIAWVSRSDAAHRDQVDGLINSFRFLPGKE